MLLRRALPSHLPQIVALERLPESRRYVGQWPEESHARALSSANARYFIAQGESGQVQAYVILRGFEENPSAIELKRLVVGQPGQGLGRRLLEKVMRMVFEECKAHRLFLDVFEDNARARHLYTSSGFIEEGVMREAAQRDGTWCSLVLMSVLESEYRRRHRPDSFLGA